MAQIENFLTHMRTLQFWNERLKNVDRGVYLTDGLLARYKVSPDELTHLEQTGAICRHQNKVEVLQHGSIDLALLRSKKAPETALHRYMKQFLMYVDLPDGIDLPIYWQVFISARNEFLDLFFGADNFSGRVHTPVSNLHKELRPELILMGEPVTSLDVSQMQPALLGNILLQNTGKNAFSDAINEGRDIYVMLQSMAGLNSREEAKKLFFRMLFGKPNNDLAALFSDGKFMDWINRYKSIPETRNPKSAKENYKIYNNLSWLLQTYEVFIMSQVWQLLAQNGIPFLSVHDEIIIRQSDTEKAYHITNMILSKHFTNYKLNSK